MELEEENIRLTEHNRYLSQENDYLKMLLDRLIPMPINVSLDTLNIDLIDVKKRLKAIENEGNKGVS